MGYDIWHANVAVRTSLALSVYEYVYTTGRDLAGWQEGLIYVVEGFSRCCTRYQILYSIIVVTELDYTLFEIWPLWLINT